MLKKVRILVMALGAWTVVNLVRGAFFVTEKVTKVAETISTKTAGSNASEQK